MMRIGSLAPTRASSGIPDARVAISTESSSALPTGACSPSTMKKSNPVPAMTSAEAGSVNVSQDPSAKRPSPIRSWKSGTKEGLVDMDRSVRRALYSQAMSSAIRSPLTREELASVRRPFRGASLLPARTYHDQEDFSLGSVGLTSIRLETWDGFVFVNLDPAAAGLREAMGDWYEHHAREYRRDFAGLRRAARREYDVGANWKIVAENYSECYHCPSIHPLLNKWTPYDQGEDFFPTGPWKGGWMPLAAGCDTMSMDGSRHGRPALAGADEV